MRWNDHFHTELPLIQAPMAGVQGSAMAIAVSQAGALGSLPCAMLSPQQMQQELAAITAQTRKPYNVNFFCHEEPEPDAVREAAWRKLLAPYYLEHGIDASSISAGAGRLPFSHAHCDVLEAFKPPVVSFHFGLPSAPLLARVRSWGSAVLASATTVEEAQWLEARGVDAVIAQGLEAGGHRGMFLCHEISRQLATLPLLAQILAAVKVPVVAAGGIADARGAAAAMALGAAAVQVGTAFLLCDEALTIPLHQAALTGPDARHTALTNLFTGRPARGIVNRAMRELGATHPTAPQFPLATAAIAPLRQAAEAMGLADFSPLWAGQNTSGCKRESAAKMARDLGAGALAGALMAQGLAKQLPA